MVIMTTQRKAQAVPEVVYKPSVQEVADYIGSLSLELAGMATEVGLLDLAKKLNSVADIARTMFSAAENKASL